MKSFVKIMSLTLVLMMALSVVMACTDDNDAVDAITTTQVQTTAPVTTTSAQTTQPQTTTTATATTDTTTAPNTTAGATTTAGDGFGPLIPLVTDKK